jgi:peptide/nickel transport system substrate-binding protein
MRRILWGILVAASCASAAAAQGTLRVAVGTSLNQLDAAKTTMGDEYIYVHLVFNGLTQINRELVTKPDLAVSWTASDDLKVWTFRLREGVKFHHGRTLDAQDVVATMSRILDPATGSRARATLSMVEKVEAIDPLTVRFILNIPYAGFQDIFAERQLRIVAKDQIGTLATKPIGTGPFQFKAWSPGDRLELQRNPDYYEPGLPKLDGVTIRIIPEAAAQLAALESGEIDILWNLPYEAVERFKNHPTIRADSVATATWDAAILNNGRPPFNDMRVRQALAATIDKEGLVELALFGQGAPTHSPIPPSHPYFNRALPFKKPDIARAKKLLAEAGYPDGFEITMQVPQEREQRVRLGVAVRDMARAAGIRVNVERVPFATYASTIEGKAQMFVDGYFARPTIDTAVYPFYHSAGSWNTQLWLYKNKRVDELLDLARTTNDEAQRKHIFDEFQAIVDETVPSILAYSAAHVNGVRKDVEGFRSTPMMWLELKGVSLKR